MEDYREKVGKLPLEKLHMLVKVYKKTIRDLELQRRDAELVAMLTIVEYSDQELGKKRAELAEIEQIIERHPSAE